MGHGMLDGRLGLDSPVHRWDPRTKLAAALALVVAAVSTPPQRLAAFVAYAGLLAWAAAAAGVPVRFVAARAALVLPFSVLAALWLPLVGGGPSLSLWGGRLSLSLHGLWILAGVVMKSFLGASALVLLIATTPFDRLLLGLRRLGAPVIMVDMLALTYRYLFVLAEDAMRLRRAAAARGYRPRWIGQALLIGRLIGALFVRSYERAERVYGAMVQRGFSGRMPAAEPLRLRPADAAGLAGCLAAIAAVRVLL